MYNGAILVLPGYTGNIVTLFATPPLASLKGTRIMLWMVRECHAWNNARELRSLLSIRRECYYNIICNYSRPSKDRLSLYPGKKINVYMRFACFVKLCAQIHAYWVRAFSSPEPSPFKREALVGLWGFE